MNQELSPDTKVKTGVYHAHWALDETGRLLLAYTRSLAVFARDRKEPGSRNDFLTPPIKQDEPPTH